MRDIKRYINKQGTSKPIFSKDVYDYVNSHEIIPYDVVMEYISRYIDQNDNINRYQKGIFYKSVNTPFGKTGINEFELISRLCIINKKGERIGYETGPALINQLGLSTQMAAKTYIVTNNHRTTLLRNTKGITLIKPPLKINNENYKYFMILDVISNKYDANIDVDDKEYKIILCNLLKKYHINIEKLLCYTKYYTSTKRKLIYATLTELMIYKHNIRNDEYPKGMLEAAKDPEFIKRNEEIMKEFEGIDVGVGGK